LFSSFSFSFKLTRTRSGEEGQNKVFKISSLNKKNKKAPTSLLDLPKREKKL